MEYLPGTIRDLPKRICDKIEIGDPDECWEWTGAKQSMGYGMVYFEGKYWLITRLVYQTVNGPLHDQDKVCHRCDDPACCNPRHLFRGSQLDNMRDCKRKSRHAHGETSYAKLTEGDVLAIRADTRTQQDIADQYGIVRQTVSDIKRRKSWHHLPGGDS